MSAPEEKKDSVNGQEAPETVENAEMVEAPEAPEAPETSAAEDAAVVESAEDASSAAGGHDHEELNLGQERVLEFISYIVVNLVEHPEDVTIDLVRRQGRDIYQVRVHQDDLGKVIGKGGQTARALRVMLTAVSARTDQRIGLEIVE